MQELAFEQVDVVSGGSSTSDWLHQEAMRIFLEALFGGGGNSGGGGGGGGGDAGPGDPNDYPGEGLPPP